MPDNENTPYQLAYEASAKAIDDQARVLESLRSRAGTLFAATALVTGFLGGQALDRVKDEPEELAFEFVSVTGLALLSFVLLALLTLAILSPYRLRFSVSAADIIGIVDARAASGKPVATREAYREIALRYEAMYDYNAELIRRLFWCFRAGILCLLIQVGAWIVVLWRAEL